MAQKTINASNARKNLFKLIEEVNKNSSQIIITNLRGKNAVLMSEDDYNVLQETVYLHSISSFVKSIIKANKEDPKKMKKYNLNEEW